MNEDFLCEYLESGNLKTLKEIFATAIKLAVMGGGQKFTETLMLGLPSADTDQKLMLLVVICQTFKEFCCSL